MPPWRWNTQTQRKSKFAPAMTPHAYALALPPQTAGLPVWTTIPLGLLDGQGPPSLTTTLHTGLVFRAFPLSGPLLRSLLQRMAFIKIIWNSSEKNFTNLGLQWKAQFSVLPQQGGRKKYIHMVGSLIPMHMYVHVCVHQATHTHTNGFANTGSNQQQYSPPLNLTTPKQYCKQYLFLKMEAILKYLTWLQFFKRMSM